MLSTCLAILLLSMGGAGCDCRSGRWDEVITKTEAVVVSRVPLTMFKGPLGEYGPACVRLTFHIDGSGSPVDINVDLSSRNRALDVAARESLEHYRFRPQPVSRADEVFALVFEI